MSSRRYYTVTRLREEIAEINDNLEQGNFSFRLREQGRNGYQAVDEYFVYPDGAPMPSGAVRNVCCGSSRECGDAAWSHYYDRHERARREGYVQ